MEAERVDVEVGRAYAAVRGGIRGIATSLLLLLGLCSNGRGDDGGHQITALEMRQFCQGIEFATVAQDGGLDINTKNHPNALRCLGAFETLHQQSLVLDGTSKKPLFLPLVCALDEEGHGKATVVFIKVFDKWVDDHPENGGDMFVSIAWQAFTKTWPCPNSPVNGKGHRPVPLR